MDESQRHGEPESNRELTAIFKELARALTLVRELTRILESAARKLTELDASQRTGTR